MKRKLKTIYDGRFIVKFGGWGVVWGISFKGLQW